jgi:hypothetical protein
MLYAWKCHNETPYANTKGEICDLKELPKSLNLSNCFK